MKTFELQTKFTTHLVYLLYRYFDTLSIIKPYSSRAANSERFIVCKGLKKETSSQLIHYLSQVNEKLWEFKKLKNQIPKSSHSKTQPDFIPFQEKVTLELLDVTGFLDDQLVKKDEDFMDYIQASNMKLAIKETEAIQELLLYASEPNKLAYPQSEIRVKCLQEWHLPL